MDPMISMKILANLFKCADASRKCKLFYSAPCQHLALFQPCLANPKA